MNAKLEENQLTPSSAVPVYIVPQVEGNEPIRLTDLLDIIWQQKKAVFLSFLVCTLLAVAYGFLSTPVYRSVIHLLPPKIQDIQSLKVNYLDGAADQVTPDTVYSAALESLKSIKLRRKFFNDKDIVAYFSNEENEGKLIEDQVFNEEFNDKLVVHTDGPLPTFVTISMDYLDPVVSAQWLNGFVELANEVTIQQLGGDIRSSLDSEMAQIRNQLDNKLMLAKLRRDDEKIKLLEALAIAKSLGITGSRQSLVKRARNEGLTVNIAQLPLYMRGVSALELEILALESRESDKPFTAGYRDLEERYAFLEGIPINLDKLSAFTIDANASIPYKLESPKKLLAIMLGAVVGIIVGISLAFIRDSTIKIS